MTSEKDNGPLSDTEGGEKPVREQLQKAHITSGPKASNSDAASAATDSAHEPGNGELAGQRGRLHKKRSHEEVEGDSQDAASQPPRQHTRKRSRDSTAEEDEINNGQRKVSGERVRNGDEAAAAQAPESNGTDKEARASTPEPTGEKRSEEAVESMTSPKTKRSRLHSTVAEDKDLTSTGDSAEADKAVDAVDSQEERKSSSSTKIPPTSGFANASATSPFGALAGSKSPNSDDKPQTSASAFASSGFGALAGSSSSGFGAIGKETGGFGSGGSFAAGAESPLNAKENSKPSAASGSSFGGALGQQSAFATATSGSGFGSGASGFGKLGSQSSGGFGGGLGGTGFSSLGGGGLTSFASGKTASLLGSISKPAKPFGAPADDEEEGGEEDGGDDKAGTKSPIATEEEKQDERFYEQELETGEEDESTEFSCRAKLYNFAAGAEGKKKEWRERGFGVVRLNVRRLSPDEDPKPKARLLMRAEGSHRVVLNTPVTKDIKYGAPDGDKPQGGYLYFMGAIDEGLEVLQLKMRQPNTLELYEHILKLQAEM